MFGRQRTTAEEKGFVRHRPEMHSLNDHKLDFFLLPRISFLVESFGASSVFIVWVRSISNRFWIQRISLNGNENQFCTKFLCCSASAAAVVCGGGRCCLCVVASLVYQCWGIWSALYLMSSCNRVPIEIDKAKATELNRSAHTLYKKNRLRFQITLTHLLGRLSVTRCDLFGIFAAYYREFNEFIEFVHRSYHPSRKIEIIYFYHLISNQIESNEQRARNRIQSDGAVRLFY